MTHAVQCPQCGVRRNQRHRGWCSGPPMIKLPIEDMNQPTTAQTGLAQDQDWTPTTKTRPPEGALVEAMDSGGHVQNLRYKHNLWWFADYSMYVYYVPQFWRLKSTGQTQVIP